MLDMSLNLIIDYSSSHKISEAKGLPSTLTEMTASNQTFNRPSRLIQCYKKIKLKA